MNQQDKLFFFISIQYNIDILFKKENNPMGEIDPPHHPPPPPCEIAYVYISKKPIKPIFYFK